MLLIKLHPIGNAQSRTSTWRLGQTFPVDPSSVELLSADGGEYEYIKKYIGYEENQFTGATAFFVAEMLRLTGGRPFDVKLEAPTPPKKGKK
jgi:hypothetical protein